MAGDGRRTIHRGDETKAEKIGGMSDQQLVILKVDAVNFRSNRTSL
jgi:hypothetical protein